MAPEGQRQQWMLARSCSCSARHHSERERTFARAPVVAVMALRPLRPALAPTDVYGLNGSVAYVLFAENFAGSCWGERINAAITHAIEFGNGSGIVQLPPGDLNVSTPIRFARTARGDACARLNATRSIAAVWGCASRSATQADLPRGLTLVGTGGTSGNVYEGGTRLSWTGLPDNVMIELPAPWHCQIRRLTLHSLWVPRVTGIRYRAGWEFGTNGGKDNLFQDLCVHWPRPACCPAASMLVCCLVSARWFGCIAFGILQQLRGP